jgi:LacI family transcriptional regulator
MIIGDLADPYYSTLARAVETFTGGHGYLLITASSDEDGPRHDRIVDRLLDQRVDGLLVVPLVLGAARVRSPVAPARVFLDRPAALSQADTVLANNEGGAYTMRERQRGYVRALQEAGLRVDENVIRTDPHDAEQLRAPKPALQAADRTAGTPHHL